MPEPIVKVETVDLDHLGARQIGTRSRSTASLNERSDEIEEAILQASSMIQKAAAKAADSGDWRVTTLEATFGLTLALEAGVVVSKASAEASFEVTVTVERG